MNYYFGNQQKVIILDGPDRVGKSSIIKELSFRLQIPSFKNHREKKFFEADPGYFEKAMKYGDPYFVSYLQQSKASIILDRSYPSEFVYSQALGRETNFDMLRMVDGLYASVDAKIIVPYRTSYDKIKDDEFKILDSQMLKKIDDLYQEFIKWTNCKTLRLCVDDENLDREIKEIMRFI